MFYNFVYAFFDLCYSFVLTSLMAFLGLSKWKFAGISGLRLPPCLTRFPVAKMSKAQLGRDRKIDVIMEIPVAHGQTPLFDSEN